MIECYTDEEFLESRKHWKEVFRKLYTRESLPNPIIYVPPCYRLFFFQDKTFIVHKPIDGTTLERKQGQSDSIVVSTQEYALLVPQLDVSQTIFAEVDSYVLEVHIPDLLRNREVEFNMDDGDPDLPRFFDFVERHEIRGAAGPAGERKEMSEKPLN